MESLTSINTLYERLIFFEFFVYLKNEKNCNPQLRVRTEKKQIKYTIEFKIEQNFILFEYDRAYTLQDKKWPTWILESRPDYSVIVNNTLVAVFDAKNYFKMSSELEEKHEYYKKCISGLKKLPNLKIGNTDYKILEQEIATYWKKFQEDENVAREFHKNLLIKFENEYGPINDEYKKLNDNFKTRRQEATRDILSYVTNLDINYGGIIFPKQEYKEFTFPNEKKHLPKFHHNLKFEYLQLDYDPNNAISTRNDTVEKMYNAIKFAIESQLQFPEITI
jgi:hypothetical protein